MSILSWHYEGGNHARSIIIVGTGSVMGWLEWLSLLYQCGISAACSIFRIKQSVIYTELC